MSALAWLCGVGVVGGLALALSGVRHEIGLEPRAPRRLALAPDTPTRLAAAAVGAVALGLLTGWPVAVVAGAALGYFARELVSPPSVRHAPIERTEAVAAWTEQLRDTMGAGAGLQQAIVATAPLAPEPIRAPLLALAHRAGSEGLVTLLEQLADELADPTADLVLSALVLAASGEAQELGEVLSGLAESARDDAALRRHVDGTRARTRTSVRAVTAIALVTLVGLLLLGGSYLRPYGTALGQVVLACVFACYGAGVFLLQRMTAETAPERILARRATGARP